MKVIFVTLWFFISCAKLLATAVPIPPQFDVVTLNTSAVEKILSTDEIAQLPNQLFFTVVKIMQGNSTATGFLMESPLPQDPNKKIVVLITNAHAIVDMQAPLRIHFHTSKDGKPVLGPIKEITIKNLQNRIFRHPNKDVDLVAINVADIINNQSNEIFSRFIPKGILADVHGGKLSVMTQVSFVGYSFDFYDKFHNLPIQRFGHVASLPTVPFNGSPIFLIEAQVFPGSSGSPVFSAVRGSLVLVGVVANSPTITESVKSRTKIYQEVTNLGFGGVVPANYIDDLLSIATRHVLETKL